MSMPQVYLAKIDDSTEAQVFSSKWKAISYFNRMCDKPDFQHDRETNITLVSVDGSTVGWITKKMVQ